MDHDAIGAHVKSFHKIKEKFYKERYMLQFQSKGKSSKPLTSKMLSQDMKDCNSNQSKSTTNYVEETNVENSSIEMSDESFSELSSCVDDEGNHFDDYFLTEFISS